MRPPRTRGIVIAAYDDTNSLERACPCCGAGIREWCTRPDGELRRVPCVARAEPGPSDDDEPSPRDFGQPIHQRD